MRQRQQLQRQQVIRWQQQGWLGSWLQLLRYRRLAAGGVGVGTKHRLLHLLEGKQAARERVAKGVGAEARVRGNSVT